MLHRTVTISCVFADDFSRDLSDLETARSRPYRRDVDPFAGIRVSDLVTFVTVHRTRSVAAAARELKVTSSQVSKALARLESRLGVRLFSRGAHGVSTTTAGLDVLPSVAVAIEAMRKLQPSSPRSGAPIELAVAGPSYLVAQLVPAIAAQHSNLHLRGRELMPGVLRAALGDNVFDLAFAVGDLENATSGWAIDRVGTIHAALFGSPKLAESLGKRPLSEARVRSLAFVAPLIAPAHFSVADDGCPLPIRERRVEHHMQTVGGALELAAQTGRHVAFAPRLAARRLVQANALVEIDVEGWNVADPLLLISSLDRVLDRDRKAIRKTLTNLPDLKSPLT